MSLEPGGGGGACLSLPPPPLLMRGALGTPTGLRDPVRVRGEPHSLGRERQEKRGAAEGARLGGRAADTRLPSCRVLPLPLVHAAPRGLRTCRAPPLQHGDGGSYRRPPQCSSGERGGCRPVRLQYSVEGGICKPACNSIAAVKGRGGEMKTVLHHQLNV